MKSIEIKGNAYTVLFIRLLIVLALLSLSRMLLYFFNVNYFGELSANDLFTIYFLGLRFDVAALMMLNFPFILLSVFPFNFKHKKKATLVILYITLFFNSIAITSNLIDIAYFRFTLKRSTFDVFNFLDATVGLFDISKALISDYWSIILLAGLFIFLMVFSTLKIKEKSINTKPSTILIIYKILLFFLISGISVLGLRGGTQLKPLNLIDAGRMVNSNLVPLVLNTPFSLIVTRGQQQLELKSWFNKEEAEIHFNPVHTYNQEGLSFDKENVVVLILESFSTNKIGYFNSSQKSLTPFLDSLLDESLTFKGIANGKKSIEGIPAILSGIPTLMRQPFLTSAYASNSFSSLASVLKNKGYTTAFFHGGKNGTMNFDSYVKKAGFDSYFGLNEYENKEDYDGSWGIWDHHFYPFFKSKLDHFEEPFFAAFFSLSSHHPYAIPEEYQARFNKTEALDGSLAYADFALSEFFNSAKKEDWFEHTLFIITADHTAELPNTRDSSNLVHFEIPIAFYSPSDSTLTTKEHRKIMQQSDIFPSVMDYLNYSDPILAFGNSVFDTTAPDFALYYLNEMYFGVCPNFSFEFNGRDFSYSNPNIFNQNSLENQVKGLIQNYSDFMIYNKLIVAE
jgi:phosphoglycerol transferase MdoB-like AlkP superfamily enzyme